MTTVSEILEQYHQLSEKDAENDENIQTELEYRITLSNPRIFEALFNKYLEEDTPVFEQTLIAITDRVQCSDPSNRFNDTDRAIFYFSKGNVWNSL